MGKFEWRENSLHSVLKMRCEETKKGVVTMVDEYNYRYLYKGQEYSNKELVDRLIMEHELKEKKKKWWRRNFLERFSFVIGFEKGMAYGVDLAIEGKYNKLIRPRNSATKERREDD